LILHKNYLINRLQHRVPEFEIFDPNEKVNIGRISPFSTLNNTSGQHRQAVTIKSMHTCLLISKKVFN